MRRHRRLGSLPAQRLDGRGGRTLQHGPAGRPPPAHQRRLLLPPRPAWQQLVWTRALRCGAQLLQRHAVQAIQLRRLRHRHAQRAQLLHARPRMPHRHAKRTILHQRQHGHGEIFPALDPQRRTHSDLHKPFRRRILHWHLRRRTLHSQPSDLGHTQPDPVRKTA